MFDQLRTVPLLAHLPDDDLGRICRSVSGVTLAAGETLFSEGDAGRDGYVIVAGELEVVKSAAGRETLLAVRGPGEVIGEMALLQEAPRMATVRARTDGELIRIPGVALDEMLESSPGVARAMLATLLERWEETNERLRHTDRMAQLGTLTAGVAHELNNPAAAVARAGARLGAALEEYARAAAEAGPEAFAAHGADTDGEIASIGPLERADREDEVAATLGRAGITDAARMAPDLVDAGIDAEGVALLLTDAPDPNAAVALAVARARVRGLVTTVSRGAGRLSTIVGALRSYSYLDRGAVQAVDVVQGIEDALLLLDHRLRGIEVRRDFPERRPVIEGSGSELNQVWTNLLANAADALAETDRPEITVSVASGPDEVVVRVTDNGPGIPESDQARVFDPFFTTKPPGQGTGLGLQITQSILVLDHRGTIDLRSRPGETVFEVRLPAGPSRSDEERP